MQPKFTVAWNMVSMNRDAKGDVHDEKGHWIRLYIYIKPWGGIR